MSAQPFELTAEQVNEAVSALYARLAETRGYLRGYRGDTVLPHHDDCCPRHQTWMAAHRSERESLEAREALILGALHVLNPEDGAP